MKFVIQRCQEASVSVDGKTVGAIEKGLMVLIGVGKDDTTEVVDKYLKKLLQLRIFEDENGKTNRSLMDIGGQLLLVSQFTLYANCRHGNRPGFTDAGDPQKAEELYEYMIEKAKEQQIERNSETFCYVLQIRMITYNKRYLYIPLSCRIPG